MLRELNQDGCASSTLEALTGDPSPLRRLQETGEGYEAARADEVTAQAAALQSVDDLGDGNEKVFLVQYLEANRPVIDPHGLLAKTALNTNIKAIADAYFQLRTRVADINIWRNLPSSHPPVSSQLWHRDQPDDYYIFKMFVYLEDVTRVRATVVRHRHARQGRPHVEAGQHLARRLQHQGTRRGHGS